MQALERGPGLGQKRQHAQQNKAERHRTPAWGQAPCASHQALHKHRFARPQAVLDDLQAGQQSPAGWVWQWQQEVQAEGACCSTTSTGQRSSGSKRSSFTCMASPLPMLYQHSGGAGPHCKGHIPIHRTQPHPHIVGALPAAHHCAHAGCACYARVVARAQAVPDHRTLQVERRARNTKHVQLRGGCGGALGRRPLLLDVGGTPPAHSLVYCTKG